MRQKIIDIIKEKEDLSLTAFKRILPDIVGEFDFFFPMKGVANSNILLVSGVSESFIKTMTDLINEGIITFKPCDVLVLSFDGGEVYNLPIAKPRKSGYKKLRWLPLLILKGEKFPR